jgi:alginate O-acetyltransferase complex protein AlgI
LERICRDNAGVIFNSYQFLFAFLPVALAGTWLLARFSAALAQFWLIAASLFFYGAWNVRYLPLLLGSIGFNYLIATLMMRSGYLRVRGWLMGCAVAVNLGLLGYYKYTGFFLETCNELAGTGFDWKSAILPLGISFYTFQQLTLLVDVSSGDAGTFRFRDFLLFVIFFPHLIAGPIVHHREMMPQFKTATWRLHWDNVAIGGVLLAVGLFKKVVLADSIAEHVSPIFAAASKGEPITLPFAWAAAIGFTLQMYFDFSGYSEMALGLARMVGIKLPMNFNSPLKALSVVDYWSRWHITLTRFLTAYIYTPLAVAQSRRRAARGLKGLAGVRTTRGAFLAIIAVPTIVTMFLSGLWHGAGNQFLLFGVLHGMALVCNHAWRLVRPRVWADTEHYQRTFRPFAWLLTFLVVMVALVWFHATSVAAGLNIVSGLFGFHGAAVTSGPTDFGVPAPTAELAVFAAWIVVLLAIVLVPPNILEMLSEWEPAVTMPAAAPFGRLDLCRGLAGRLRLTLTPPWALATGAILAIGLMGVNRVSEFLYWQF